MREFKGSNIDHEKAKVVQRITGKRIKMPNPKNRKSRVRKIKQRPICKGDGFIRKNRSKMAKKAKKVSVFSEIFLTF